jgi:hypothetical protein
LLRKYGLVTIAVFAAFGVLIAALSGSGKVTLRVLEIVVPVSIGCALFIAFSIVLAILVHELGHVAAGLLAGFRFQAMQVGPMEVRLQATGLKLGFVETPRLSGFVRMTPRSEEQVVPRMLLFILGGPVASLVYVLVTYVLFRAFPEPKRGVELLSGIPHLATFSLFVMGLSVLPGTLLPFTSHNGNPTDMRVLLTLIGPQAVRERLVAILLIGRELQSGVRARNWSSAAVERAVSLRDGGMEELRARILAYYHYMDLGNEREARAHVVRAAELADQFGKKSGTLRELSLYELAYVTALYDRNPEEASRILTRVGPPTGLLRGTAALAEAAIAATRGEASRSCELLVEAQGALEEVHRRYGGAIEFDFDRIARIRNSMRGDA